jgi:AraC-like DNA-binding protein
MRELLVRLAENAQSRGREHLAALLFLEIETAHSLPLHLPLPRDRRLRRLTDALCANPGDTRPLKYWAGKLGMSERSLIRRFGAETGMTFRHWRRQARLLGALERLVSGEQVTTVALAVGYDSVSAFIAAFRGVFGETPKRYAGSLDSSSDSPAGPRPAG